MTIAMVVDLLSETVMLTVPYYFVRMACFFVLGLTQMKSSIPYSWLTETCGADYKSRCITILNCFDAMSCTVLCLYLVFVSRDAWWLLFCSVTLGYVVLLSFFFLPESPLWLLIRGR